MTFRCVKDERGMKFNKDRVDHCSQMCIKIKNKTRVIKLRKQAQQGGTLASLSPFQKVPKPGLGPQHQGLKKAKNNLIFEPPKAIH